MAKFFVIHPVGSALTVEAATPIAKSIKANHTTDAYWIRTVYAKAEGKLYCEWDAKDAESIRKVLDKAAPGFPTEGIYELDPALMVNSESFR